MRENLGQLRSQVERANKDKEGKLESVEILQHHVTEQQTKIARAEKQSRAISKGIRTSCACLEDETILLQEVTRIVDDENYLDHRVMTDTAAMYLCRKMSPRGS